MDVGRFVRFVLPLTAVLLLGCVLRVLGYFDPALQLWLDEASWAEMLVNGTGTWIRPAGYMALSKLLVSIVNTEPMLRSLSFIAGFALLFFINPIFRRTTTTNAVVVFGVFILAIHPSAVSMAKEFKPYALEAAIHGALIFFVVRWLAEHRRRDLIAFLVVAMASPFFAWSVIFAFPGLFLLVGLETWKRGEGRDFMMSFVGGVVTLINLVVIFAMRLAGENEKSGFWGKKYDVFYIGKSHIEAVGWQLQKTFDVAGFPGRLEIGFPEPLATTIESILVPLTAVLVLSSFVVLLVRRRWTSLAVWALPWALTLLFNVIGKWPYGVFRTNLFLLVYSLGLLVQGLEEVATWRPWSATMKRAGTLVLVVVGVIVFPWDFDHFRIKEERSMALSTSIRTALEQIAADAPTDGPIDLILDGHACGTFRYYTRVHEQTVPTLGATFVKPRFRVVCGRFMAKDFQKNLEGITSSTAYVLIAKPSFPEMTRETLAAVCTSAPETALPGTTHWFRCTTRAPSSVAQPASATMPAATGPMEDDSDEGTP